MSSSLKAFLLKCFNDSNLKLAQKHKRKTYLEIQIPRIST